MKLYIELSTEAADHEVGALELPQILTGLLAEVERERKEYKEFRLPLYDLDGAWIGEAEVQA